MATVEQITDNTQETPGRRAPLVLGDHDYRSITESICRLAEKPKTPPIWYIALACSSSLTFMLFGLIGYMIFTGVGVWGNNQPVYWGWPIVNFVFWVGIGHAGTLISAILFLFRQNWRT
ncbi:MAG: hydrogenase, partial [Pirellulaceae bacterium]